jgi:hypothetical protein
MKQKNKNKIPKVTATQKAQVLGDTNFDIWLTTRRMPGLAIFVQLQNEQGETMEAPLPKEPMTDPTKFREWLLSQGNFVWSGGPNELSRLRTDIRQAVKLLKTTNATATDILIWKCGNSKYQKYLGYIKRVGRPCLIEWFDDDWAPVGYQIRAEMEALGLIKQHNNIITIAQ